MKGRKKTTKKLHRILPKMAALLLLFSMMAMYVPDIGHADEETSATYYVDAETGDDDNEGLSELTAWQTLNRVNEVESFQPGDRILLKRGQRFSGMLSPKGSGLMGSPITIADYGVGARPIIDATEGGPDNPVHIAAIQLKDQEHWRIENIETTGGGRYGIHVGATTASNGKTLRGIHIENCNVYGVFGESTVEGDMTNGCIIIEAMGEAPFEGDITALFEDVSVIGCTAHSTKRWAGILFFGSFFTALGEDGEPATDDDVFSKNITIQNCTAYDLYGDGIVVFVAENVLIDNCVAYDTGKAPVAYVGNSNAIWTWHTKDTIMQYCEAYNAKSPTTDGGGFDIDFYNINNTIQYCYAHDNWGYGAAIFGSKGGDTVNSIIRYNVFANNGRYAPRASYGDIYLASWDDGYIKDVAIYNNTSYWNPVVPYAAFNDTKASYRSSNNNLIFKNNIIYSNVPQMVNIKDSAMVLDNNCYWYTGSASGSGLWKIGDVTYDSLEAFQNATQMDMNSYNVDPKLTNPTYNDILSSQEQMPRNSFSGMPGYMLATDSPLLGKGAVVDVDMGSQDFFGNPQPTIHNIGAYEGPGVIDNTTAVPVTNWALNTQSFSMGKNTSVLLKVTAEPNNATNVKTIWESDNTDVATVNEYGKVTAVNAGTAVITATLDENGNGIRDTEENRTDACVITVQQITYILDTLENYDQLFSKSDGWFLIEANHVTNEPAQIAPYPVPSEGAVPQNIVYTMDDMGYFKFNVKYYTYPQSDTNWENPVDFDNPAQYTSVRDSVYSEVPTLLYGFKTYISEDNAQWQAIDVHSTTIKTEGGFRFIQYKPVDVLPEGTRYIKFEVYDNNAGWSTILQRAEIIHRDDLVGITEITPAQPSLSMKTSQYRTISVTVNEDATNQDIGWSSGNSDIAVVDNFGLVKARKPGQTFIRAYSVSDPSVETFIPIVVTDSTEITDDLNNLNRVIEHSPYWVEEGSLIFPTYTYVPEYLIYRLADIEDFNLYVNYLKYDMYWAPVDFFENMHYDLKVLVSKDMDQWEEITLNKEIIGTTADTLYDQVQITPNEKIPPSMNYIRYEFTDTSFGYSTQPYHIEIKSKPKPVVSDPDPDPDPTPQYQQPAPTPMQHETIEAGKIIAGQPLLDEITGEATVTLKKESFDKAMAGATEDKYGRKTVQLEVPKTTDASAYRVELPASVLTDDTDNQRIEIMTDYGTVTAPTKLLVDAHIQEDSKVAVTIAAIDKSELDKELQATIGDKPVIDVHISVDGERIQWHSKETLLKIAIPYTPTQEELADPDHIVVWYIESSGQVVSVPSGKYDPETGMVTFYTNHLSQFAVSFVKKTFKDVGGLSAKNQIEALASRGIIKGTSNDLFSPQKNITRGDFVLLLVRMFGLQADFEESFFDVAVDDYYYEAIGIASKLGIVRGTGNHLFQPKQALTSQDMYVLAARVLNIIPVNKQDQNYDLLAQYTDKTEVAGYAVQGIEALVEKKLLNYLGSSLRPRDTATRAEAAQLLYNIYFYYYNEAQDGH